MHRDGTLESTLKDLLEGKDLSEIVEDNEPAPESEVITASTEQKEVISEKGKTPDVTEEWPNQEQEEETMATDHSLPIVCQYCWYRCRSWSCDSRRSCRRCSSPGSAPTSGPEPSPTQGLGPAPTSGPGSAPTEGPGDKKLTPTNN